MAEQDIAQQWKAFSPEQRTAAIGKMSPEQKIKLKQHLEGGATPTQTAAPEENPGFFKRAAQGLGLPSSSEEIKAASPNLDNNWSKVELGAGLVGGSPLVNIAHQGVDYVRNFLDTGKKDLGEMRKALKGEYTGGTNAAGTGPSPTPNLDRGVHAAVDFLTRGVLGPVGGNAVANLYEDSEKHNIPAMLGDAGAVVANIALAGNAKDRTATERTNKLAFASGKGAVHDIKHSLTEMDKTAQLHGAPKTVGELQNNLQLTMNRMNTEAGVAMHPLRGKETVPTNIADQIKSKITPNMDKTPEGRQMKQALMNKAKQYKRPWSYEALDHERMQSYARLKSLANKSSAEQYSQMLKDPSVAVDKIVNQGVKDYIYPEMDRIAGKPKGYFSELKGRQSAVIGLSETLENRIKKLEDQSAIAKGAPAFSAEQVSAYSHNLENPGVSVHGLAKSVLKPDVLKQADKRVKLGFNPGGNEASKAAVYTLPIRSLMFNQPPANRKEAMDSLQPPQ